MALDHFRAAPLPNPPMLYDPQYMRQLIRVLETYFTQLDSNTPNHAETYTADDFYGGELHGDGTDVAFPHNQFLSLTDQSAAAIDQAYPVALEVTTFSDSVSITGAGNTRITFSRVGIYTITYSLAFKNTANDAHTVDTWLRYNDGTTTTDIANSNSRFSIPARKSASEPSYLIAVTPFSVHVTAAGHYVELMWRVSDILVGMEHLDAVAYSAGVTPAIPATPSAIVEVAFTSRP